MNGPAADSAAGGGKEQGGQVFLHFHHGYSWVVSKVSRGGVAASLRWPFYAHRGGTFRMETIFIQFGFEDCHLTVQKPGEGWAVLNGLCTCMVQTKKQ